MASLIGDYSNTRQSLLKAITLLGEDAEYKPRRLRYLSINTVARCLASALAAEAARRPDMGSSTGR